MAWLRTKTLFNIARHLWSRTCPRLCKRKTLNCLSSINKLKALNLFFSAAQCQQDARFMWRIKRNNKQKQFLWLKNWIEEIDEKTKTTCRTNIENASKTIHVMIRALVNVLIVILFCRFSYLGTFETFAYLCAFCQKSNASFVKMTSNSIERQTCSILMKDEIFPLGLDDDR